MIGTCLNDESLSEFSFMNNGMVQRFEIKSRMIAYHVTYWEKWGHGLGLRSQILCDL